MCICVSLSVHVCVRVRGSPGLGIHMPPGPADSAPSAASVNPTWCFSALLPDSWPGWGWLRTRVGGSLLGPTHDSWCVPGPCPQGWELGLSGGSPGTFSTQLCAVRSRGTCALTGPGWFPIPFPANLVGPRLGLGVGLPQILCTPCSRPMTQAQWQRHPEAVTSSCTSCAAEVISAEPP